ncbi:hypothetical protein LTR64_000136 [Lithohypha guttulata]|uniref:uncharacterized protein n=1 Tax=Lithohypha guttulata TaxID=1690604 RepID=UPI002DE0E0B9|nr:hypothetical protein LTR51_007498 [Lithohypha guttulata]
MTESNSEKALLASPSIFSSRPSILPRVQTPLRDHVLSPSKRRTPSQRLSPSKLQSQSKSSRSPLRSPRTSPGKSTFQTMPKVSFTPQRERQRPRAWERRPATPYVPRDDKQKIWKRVPLGEISHDANRVMSRREQETKQDYARVVKKLKIQLDSSEDKENLSIAVGAKFADEENSHAERRRQGRDFAAGDKEDMIEREIPFLQNLEQQEDEEAEPAVTDERDEWQQTQDNNPIVTTSNSELDLIPLRGGDYQESPDTMAEAPNEEILDTVQHSPEDIPNLDLPAYSAENENEVHTKSQDNNIVDGPSSETDREMDELDENRSSSPPTILAENVTIDELEALDLPKMKELQMEPLPEHVKQTEEARVQDILDRQEKVPRRISDDEATFLRNFMSRIRAGKAARKAETDGNMIRSLIDASEALNNLQETTLPAKEHHASELEPSPEETGPEPTSPLRRSKRVVTNIPRPQIRLKRASGNEFIFQAKKAPSNANMSVVTRTNTKKNKGTAANVRARLEQLKTEETEEANTQAGSTLESNHERAEDAIEEIKANRKRTSMTAGEGATRPRKVLRWDDENLERYQEAEQFPSGVLDDIEDSSQESTGHKDEAPSKYVKLTLKMSGPAEEGDTAGLQNIDATAQDLEPNTATFTSETKDEEESVSSQTKVRKTRRGFVGSVNGTPAPKRSRRLMVDNEDGAGTNPVEAEPNAVAKLSEQDLLAIPAEEPASATTNTATKNPTTSSTSATAKSRVPMPKTRRSAAAATSIGTAIPTTTPSSTALPRLIKGGSTAVSKEKYVGRTGMTSTSGEADKGIGNAKGDLPGRRKLRIRP